MPRISVVINTFNEEKNLPFALRSVCQWVDEIVVVDMYSTDRTVEIAKQFGANVHLHAGPGFRYPPREYAVQQASEPWVLMLDADELIPVSLSKTLRDIAQEDQIDVAVIPRLNYLLGKPMAHSGWGPTQDMQFRFFRKDSIVACSTAHRDFVPKPGARTRKIAYDGRNAIVHFNYVDSTDFVERLNRYTTVEALQAMERGERPTRSRAVAHALLEFANRFIRKKGFKDGWRGFYLCLFMVFYRIAVYAKMSEFQNAGGAEGIRSSYRAEAERLLSSYDRVTST